LLPADAVLVDATQDTTRGAAPALPAETGRALLWSGGFMARKWGYDGQELARREARASALAHGGARSHLVWVIDWDDSTRAANLKSQVVARADGVVLVQFVPR